MRILFILSFFILFVQSVYSADLRFVQVSDVRYSDSNSSTLSNVIKEINREKDVEFVVFTGDNINKPEKDILIAFLEKIKALNCPYYLVLGDHDVNKHKDFGKNEYLKVIKRQVRKYKPSSHNYVFEKKGVVFVVLDGSKEVIPSACGYYKDDCMFMLKEQLQLNSDKNVIVLQHFPVIPPSEKELYYTYKADNYLKTISDYKNLKAIVSGHFGENKEITNNGVVHISTSGLPYYRVIDILDCDTDTPTIWTELKVVE